MNLTDREIDGIIPEKHKEIVNELLQGKEKVENNEMQMELS